MAKDKNKIPIKEREGFKKFLNIFPKVASGVLNVAGLVVPGASAAGKVIGAIDGMVNSGEITNEYAIQAKNYLLEQYGVFFLFLFNPSCHKSISFTSGIRPCFFNTNDRGFT